MNDTQPLTAPARIAVIDDHGIVRFGYAQLIGQEPTLEVCGMASTEKAGLDLIREQRPDLAIIDLSLDEGDGMDLIKSARNLHPGMKILVVSAHEESLFAQRVLAVGASGFINKRNAPEQLIDGVQTILQGKFFFSPSVTKTLIRRRMGNQRTVAPVGIESLTNRELHVFELVGNGKSTRKIADEMYLSVKTIERHKENIKRKLNLEDVTQLVQHATQWVLGRGY